MAFLRDLPKDQALEQQDAAGSAFRGGTLLYDRETLAPLGDRIYAIPLRILCRGV